MLKSEVVSVLGVMGSCGHLKVVGVFMASGVSNVCQRSYWGR